MTKNEIELCQRFLEAMAEEVETGNGQPVKRIFVVMNFIGRSLYEAMREAAGTFDYL